MPIFVYMNKRDEWYETGKVVQQASRTNHIRADAPTIFARRDSYPLCMRCESQGLFIAISDAVFTKLAALIPYTWILRRLYGKYTSCATPVAYPLSRAAPPPPLLLRCAAETVHVADVRSRGWSNSTCRPTYRSV